MKLCRCPVCHTSIHLDAMVNDEAARELLDTIGDKETSAITEIERYVVWPGQACSYMVGKIEWMRLRAKARKALGRRFVAIEANLTSIEPVARLLLLQVDLPEQRDFLCHPARCLGRWHMRILPPE